MQRFGRLRSLQKFVSVHASVHNHFNPEPHLYSLDNFKLNRTASLAEKRQLWSGKVHAYRGKLRLVRTRLKPPPQHLRPNDPNNGSSSANHALPFTSDQLGMANQLLRSDG